MQMNKFLSLILILFIFPNTTNAEVIPSWEHPTNSTEQIEMDIVSCEANGYKTAGQPLRHQPPPDCSNLSAFDCGYAKEKALGSNKEAEESWQKAFDKGFKSCMYEKGYVLNL